jgi:hypothetical protein
MTGKHLAPDTGREISTLKRRVTDLERQLDRIRRRPAGAAVTLAPFCWIAGTGFTAAGVHTSDGTWRYSRPANTVTATSADPTRHLAIDPTTFGEWTIRVDIAGLYQFGITVGWDDIAGDGSRRLAIQQIDNSGIVATYDIALTASADSRATTLSGSAIVPAVAGSYWVAMYGDDTGTAIAGSASSYWGRAVAVEPELVPVGSL